MKKFLWCTAMVVAISCSDLARGEEEAKQGPAAEPTYPFRIADFPQNIAGQCPLSMAIRDEIVRLFMRDSAVFQLELNGKLWDAQLQDRNQNPFMFQQFKTLLKTQPLSDILITDFGGVIDHEKKKAYCQYDFYFPKANAQGIRLILKRAGEEFGR